jgi:hypothetical protein
MASPLNYEPRKVGHTHGQNGRDVGKVIQLWHGRGVIVVVVLEIISQIFSALLLELQIGSNTFVKSVPTSQVQMRAWHTMHVFD